MKREIERKFLLKGKFKDYAVKSYRIIQGYLSSVPERSVRIRITDKNAFITIKGLSEKKGLSRFEWEKEIDIKEAKELILLCEPGIIDKVRYLIPFGNHTYEVDEFSGDNKGLTIAEIEFKSTHESFEKPDWLGEEVTGIQKYYNSQLATLPFNKW